MPRVALLCSSPCLPVPPRLAVGLMPQLIAVMSKVQHSTYSVQHSTAACYADRKPNFTVQCRTLRFCIRRFRVRKPIWRPILYVVFTVFLSIFRHTRDSTLNYATSASFAFSSNSIFTNYLIIRRYTGSLFYLTNILCHFPPPFHRASELSEKCDTFIR
jgi:hypothetical protein